MIYFTYNNQNILRLIRNMTDAQLAEVALRISETHPEAFAAALTNATILTKEVNGIKIELTADDMNHLRTYGNGDKVRAIKWMRERFGICLLEAKLLSEALVNDGDLFRPVWVGRAEIFEDKPTSLGDILKAQIRADYDDDIPF